MKNICIFCGANFNGDPTLKQAIDELVETFVACDITMVYGGARAGMMGMLADGMLRSGGRVVGVIPQFLMDKEIAHTGLTELYVVQSMHARKQLMVELSDGIIAMPGGAGTLDEFFEAFTWLQLGLHTSAVGLLNVNGFYNLLLQHFDMMVTQGFMKAANRNMLFTSTNVIDLLGQMETFKAQPHEVWFKK
ncbi:MAG: TIGR00730 family Rossman fold protein [Sphingobacteriaceae bacterium]|nr:MAG: TIGR00730 family Rossman fold protein [Sphingobacteriaceae bacterium]